MEHVVCDLCGGGDLVEVYCDPGFEIPSALGIRQIDITNVICRTCGLIFINPRLPEAAVREFYAAQTRPREVPEGGGVSALPRGESVRRDQCERILEEWNSHAEGRILDIGSFEGYFLSLFKRRGWSCVGVEPAREAVLVAREHYDLEILEGMFEDFPQLAGVFDVVSVRHVLEHVRQPSHFLHLARKALKPEGLLFIEVPDASRPRAVELDDFFSFQHLYNFSPTTLKAMLSREGFEVKVPSQLLPYGAFRTLAWWRAGRPSQTIEPGNPTEYRRLHGIVREYAQERQSVLDRLKSKIAALVDETRGGDARVAVFGAGFHTRELFRRTNMLEAPIVALVDSDPAKHGSDLAGLTVQSPSSLAEARPTMVLVSSYAFQDEISGQLTSLEKEGVRVVRLYGKVQAYDTFTADPGVR
ncbi:MAG: class I SAM-dependent methyltransferase [Acidobacteria bacterium]|nr:class I SAM-dependent methyltransferase [Acidobacteriota bacterium]